jgi:hypothetical protein
MTDAAGGQYVVNLNTRITGDVVRTPRTSSTPRMSYIYPDRFLAIYSHRFQPTPSVLLNYFHHLDLPVDPRSHTNPTSPPLPVTIRIIVTQPGAEAQAFRLTASKSLCHGGCSASSETAFMAPAMARTPGAGGSRKPLQDFTRDEKLWFLRSTIESCHREITWRRAGYHVYQPSALDDNLPELSAADFSDTCNKSVPVYILETACGPSQCCTAQLHLPSTVPPLQERY